MRKIFVWLMTVPFIISLIVQIGLIFLLNRRIAQDRKGEVAQKHQLTELQKEITRFREKISTCTNVEACRDLAFQIPNVVSEEVEIAKPLSGAVVLIEIGTVILLGLLWGGLVSMLLHVYKRYESLEFKYRLLTSSQHLHQDCPNKD